MPCFKFIVNWGISKLATEQPEAPSEMKCAEKDYTHVLMIHDVRTILETRINQTIILSPSKRPRACTVCPDVMIHSYIG